MCVYSKKLTITNSDISEINGILLGSDTLVTDISFPILLVVTVDDGCYHSVNSFQLFRRTLICIKNNYNTPCVWSGWWWRWPVAACRWADDIIPFVFDIDIPLLLVMTYRNSGCCEEMKAWPDSAIAGDCWLTTGDYYNAGDGIQWPMTVTLMVIPIPAKYVTVVMFSGDIRESDSVTFSESAIA